MTRGRFITLEGGEGAGKSTAMNALEQMLQQRQVPYTTTREPGGTELGEELRGLLLHPRCTAVDPMAELLMIFAARAQHVAQVIRPALEAGQWVLCDRFTAASFAYQGMGRGMGREPVAALEELVQGSLRPDLTLLLDVPVQVGLERARGRGDLDRFESEDLAFFERVRSAYLEQAQRDPGRFVIIDAQQPLERVHGELVAALAALLGSAAQAAAPGAGR